MNYELIIRRSFGVSRNDIITLGAQAFFETMDISIPMLEIALRYTILRYRDNNDVVNEISCKLRELNENAKDYDVDSLSTFCNNVITVYNDLGVE